MFRKNTYLSILLPVNLSQSVILRYYCNSLKKEILIVQSKRPIIIGIAGGSGSGKTTIAHEIYDQLQQDDHI